MTTPVTPAKLRLMKLAAQKRVEEFRMEATRQRLKSEDVVKARKLIAQATSHFNAMQVTLAFVAVQVDSDVQHLQKASKWIKEISETPVVETPNLIQEL